MRISLDQFAGEVPKIPPRYLPPINGQTVSAARLTRGDLAPMRNDVTLATLGSSAVSIYQHEGAWLSWNYDADCVPGPVADNRLYITRAVGVPQVYNAGSFYNLALPAPTGGMTAALAAVEGSYFIPTVGSSARFTYTNSKWIRSAGTVSVTTTKDDVTPVIGQNTLVNTIRARRRLVALLPKSPTTGQSVVIGNRGAGRLVIHRNGKTIDGDNADKRFKTGTKTSIFTWNGTTWVSRVISPSKFTVTVSDASNIAGAYRYVANFSARVAVNTPKTQIFVRLPVATTLGQMVFVERSNVGPVAVEGQSAQTIDSASFFDIEARGDRWVFVWSGSTWNAIQIDGALTDAFVQSRVSMALSPLTSTMFYAAEAPPISLIELPVATAAQSFKVAASGANDAVVLPCGKNINGDNDIYTLFGSGDFDTFTYSGTAWTTDTSDIRTIDRSGDALSGDIIVGLSSARKIRVSFPSSAEDGDTIDVVRAGAKTVSCHNLISFDLAESTKYVYTWRTSLGEESQPSTASNTVRMTPGRNVTLTMPAVAPASRLITHRRIYRSATSESGITDLYFVAQITAATTTFTDNLSNPIEEVIPTIDYDKPVDALRGLTAMPNGMMAAFQGSEVFFCEPYIPHAWPARYSIKVNAPIVGLVAFGSVLAVLTKSTPWIMQGLHPDSVSAQKIETPFPCLSKRGIVDMGYAAIYPSTDGLVRITADGGAALLSNGLWDTEQWKALKPETFRAAQYGSRYAFSYDPDGLGITRKLAFIDTSGELPFLIPVNAASYKDITYQVETGRLIGLDNNGLTIRSIEDPAAGFRTAEWWSKPFILPTPTTFSTVRIDAEPPATGTPTFSLGVYADNVLLHTITEVNALKRLPAKVSANWSFRFLTNYTVTRAVIAGTADELFE